MQFNDEMLTGKTISALGFSYVDEYNEDYGNFDKEDDFENVDDNALNEFDDDIYSESEIEEDESAYNVDSYSDSDFDDDFDSLSEEYDESEDL